MLFNYSYLKNIESLSIGINRAIKAEETMQNASVFFEKCLSIFCNFGTKEFVLSNRASFRITQSSI